MANNKMLPNWMKNRYIVSGPGRLALAVRRSVYI